MKHERLFHRAELIANTVGAPEFFWCDDGTVVDAQGTIICKCDDIRVAQYIAFCSPRTILELRGTTD
jgi:hypothetical protein